MKSDIHIIKNMKPLHIDCLPKQIRDKIRSARKARKWSQRELGEKTGTSQHHISLIENGKTVPRADRLLEILWALELDLLIIPKSKSSVFKALARNLEAEGKGPDYMARPRFSLDDDDLDDDSLDEPPQELE